MAYCGSSVLKPDPLRWPVRSARRHLYGGNMASDGFHPNLRHIRASELDAETAQTSGMHRLSAISAHRVGSAKLWMGQTHVAPAQRSGDHHHGEAETAIYVVSGSPEFVFLDEQTGEEVRLRPAAGRLRVRPAVHPASRREQRSRHRGRRRARAQHARGHRGQPALAAGRRHEARVAGRVQRPSARARRTAQRADRAHRAVPARRRRQRLLARSTPTATRAALEAALGGLEGGTALAFASGMAAIAAVVDLQPAGTIAVVPRRGVLGRGVDLRARAGARPADDPAGRSRRHRRGDRGTGRGRAAVARDGDQPAARGRRPARADRGGARRRRGGRRRRHVLDAGQRAPARTRRRHRHALGHEVPVRPLGRADGRARHRVGRAGAGAARPAHADRRDPRRARVVPGAARAAHARPADGTRAGQRAGAGRRGSRSIRGSRACGTRGCRPTRATRSRRASTPGSAR